MRILPSIILTLVCWLLSCSSPALAGAMQSSRSQTAVTVGQNTIIADSSVKYVGYLAGDTITVTLAYSASCNIVFQDLAGARRRGAVAVEIASVSGTPVPARVTNTGSVTFDLSFNTLGQTATGAQSGVARLNLVLGVDRDCDLATGDLDGIDGPTTIPVQISVFTDSRED